MRPVRRHVGIGETVWPESGDERSASSRIVLVAPFEARLGVSRRLIYRCMPQACSHPGVDASLRWAGVWLGRMDADLVTRSGASRNQRSAAVYRTPRIEGGRTRLPRARRADAFDRSSLLKRPTKHVISPALRAPINHREAFPLKQRSQRGVLGMDVDLGVGEGTGGGS